MKTLKIDGDIKSQLSEFINFTTNLALGKHPTLSPPFTKYQEDNNDILSFYNSFFADYLKNLKSIDNQILDKVNMIMQHLIEKNNRKKIEFNIIKETESICHTILDATTDYFKGLPACAYETFEKTMIENNCHLLKLLPQILSKDFHFYRVRKGQDFKDRKELFHTPFQLRVKCDSYRFSTLGYPSLYLASTLETALLESNVKDLKEYSCSCFKSTRELRFIDLALPNRELAFWEQYSLAIFYPLIMACNLKVKQKDEPFKPEYIIPQLLVQTIRLHSDFIDGISYISTKHKKICYTDFNQRNFIMYIPYAEAEEGYSKVLAEKLVSTKPMSCYVEKATTVKEIEEKCNKLNFDKIIF